MTQLLNNLRSLHVEKTSTLATKKASIKSPFDEALKTLGVAKKPTKKNRLKACK